MFIGVDLGTTTIKAACFDKKGKIVCVKKRKNKIFVPQDGWAEINPKSLWENVQNLLYEIAGQINEEILAISFSSQGEGVVPLDEKFHPVGNIILSYDQRAREETHKIREQISEENMYNITGHIISSVHTAAKIAWILNNPSWCRKRPFFFACVSDYIISCFGLEPSTDYSLAARTMMLDVKTLEWSNKILNLIGITEKQLPRVFPAGTLLGKADKRVLPQMFFKNTCIVQGGHDQPCSKYGCSVLKEGEVAYSLGTTETLICEMNSFMPDLRLIGLSCYPHIIKDKFITLPGNFTGGNIIEWFCSQFERNPVLNESQKQGLCFDSVIYEMSSKPTNLLVLPHFTTTGSPYNDDASTGAIIGLNVHTTKGDVVRALIEGVTYEILLNIRLLNEKGLKITKLIAMGGVTQSAKIMQLKSDLLGLPIDICAVQETACRGAAMLAAAGVDTEFVKPFFTQMNQEKRLSFNPKTEYTLLYDKNFIAYKNLYNAVKNIKAQLF